MTSSTAKSITVRQPEPGLWRVSVDPARVPGGRTPFTLSEVIANPRFGRVDIEDTPSPRAPGATWTSRAIFKPNDAGEQQPLLAAFLEVVDDGIEGIERAHRENSWARVPNRPIALGVAVVALR